VLSSLSAASGMNPGAHVVTGPGAGRGRHESCSSGLYGVAPKGFLLEWDVMVAMVASGMGGGGGDGKAPGRAAARWLAAAPSRRGRRCRERGWSRLPTCRQAIIVVWPRVPSDLLPPAA